MSQYVCDWGNCATGCTMQSLAPITCQKDGCDIPVHHVCQIGFEASINYQPPRISTNCRAHHEGYCNMMKNKQGAASSARITRTNQEQHKNSSPALTTHTAANSSQMSGLTSDSSSETEDNESIVVEPPTEAAAAANLPPSIGSVWEHPLVEVIKVPNGLGKQKTKWKCLARGCGLEWSGANSSKALAHGSRDNAYCLQVHVKACKGAASQAEIDLFCSLLKNRERKKTAVKRANELITEDIVSSQGSVSDGILQKREKSRGGGSGGFAAANPSLSRNADEGTSVCRQIDLRSSFDKSTISGCNSADLDAAIAQLVYCKGLPFSFGECPYFQRVIDVARCAPRGYKPPKRGILAGEMLDLAYTTQLERDVKQLMIDADIFGIAFFGDGATIHKCPLVNLFASALHCPAVLINIIDCTARLVEGEKKDGNFISSLFLPVIESLDVLKDKADVVFFDGGSNFQLAGRIIRARFP